MKRFILFLIVTTFGFVHSANAQVPLTLGYQAVLTDATATPLADGDYDLTFKLYDVAAGGIALWTETQTVSVLGGVFSVALGSATALSLPFDTAYWLGVSVGTDAELDPRVALTASAYSLSSRGTVNEPADGDSFAIRTTDGETAHLLSANGDVEHAGIGFFGEGIVVGPDTTVFVLPDSVAGKVGMAKQAPDVPSIGIRAEGSFIGVWGFSTPGTGVIGLSKSGDGVFGGSFSGLGIKGDSDSGRGVQGQSKSSEGVFGQSTSGTGVKAISGTGIGLQAEGDPAGDFIGQVKISDVPLDQNNCNVLVWGTDMVVKYKELCDTGGGGESAWLTEGGNIVSTTADVVIRDPSGIVTTRFNTDGTSFHAGLETFAGGLVIPNSGGGSGNAVEIIPGASWAFRVNGSSRLAGNALIDGNVTIIGNLSKSSGSFRIDHPLDPENKYLYHSFVESPDMMNVYNGNIELNALGEAIVQLPDYFAALNMDFRYQLTPIEAPGPNLYIGERIQNNQFKIRGGTPGLEVSWQVTGIRQDKWAKENRIQVEVEKELSRD